MLATPYIGSFCVFVTALVRYRADRVMTFQWGPFSNSQNPWLHYLSWQKGPCRCDKIQDLEMERFSRWTHCNHKGPYKGETGGGVMERGSESETRRCYTSGFEDGGKGHKPRNATATKNRLADCPLEPLEGACSCWHLSFSPRIPDLQNYKIINLCYCKLPLHRWCFVTAARRNEYKVYFMYH